ncbi:MAG: hypothetical protein IKE65_04650 [Clostridia bacterium]|nr:hypothetical protein [Clostridia bacterium]
MSSIAMLLVAVVALGGATYAWFSANTAATASGVNIASSQQTSLLFAPLNTPVSSDAWSSSVDLATADPDAMTVTPCSSVNGTNFYVVTIGNSTSELATEVTGVEEADATNNYYESAFLAKSSVANHLKLDTLTVTQNEFAGLLRVSVQVTGSTAESSTNEAKIFYVGNTAPTNVALGSTSGASFPNDVTFADLYDTDITPTPDDGESHTGDIAGLTKALPTYSVPGAASAVWSNDGFTVGSALTITVRVWLEGNSAACGNSMMNKAVSGLTLSFSTV